MKLKCLIIEDEPLAIQKLEGFIRQTADLEHIKSFSNPLDGMEYLNNHSSDIDILFLDVQMKNLNGIELLQALSQKPNVIITSAYSEYAIDGYELDVFDYLLKPIEYKRFLKSINKLRDYLRNGVKSSTNIWLKTEGRYEQINPNHILYVEGMREYLEIVLMNRKIMIKDTFSGLLQKLPNQEFIQTHKSWMVRIDKIEQVEQNLIYIKNKVIPVGNKYKDNLWNVIK